MESNSNYIERLVSHIKNKDVRESAQAELSDHYIEKQRHYKEIGYDEESAMLKAQEDIGDADVLGEQLNIKPKKAVDHYIPLMILLLICGFIMRYYTGSSEREILIETVIWFLIPVFLLLVMVRSMKQNSETAIVINLLGSGYMLYSHIIPVITDIITGADTSFIHYMRSYDVLTNRCNYDYFYSDTQQIYLDQFDSYEKIYNTLCVIIIGIVILCGIWSIVISIKISYLINTKNDYLISVVLRKVMIAIVIITVAASIADVFIIASFPKKYKSGIKQELVTEDERLLKIIKNDEISSLLSGGEFVDYSKNGTVRTQSNFNKDGFSLMLTEFEYLDDEKTQVYSRSDGEKIIEKMKSVKVIEEAPKPYEMEFSLLPSETVSIIYPCEYFGELKFTFSKEKGEYVFSESATRTDIDIQLPKEIRSECETLLKEYFKNGLYKKEFLSYPDAEILFVSEEYRVNYDDISGSYEFLYYGLLPVMVTETEGKSYIVSPEKSKSISHSVRISLSDENVKVDDNVSKKIMDTSDFDYSDFPHDSSTIADYFSAKQTVELSGYIYYFDEISEHVVHDFESFERN